MLNDKIETTHFTNLNSYVWTRIIFSSTHCIHTLHICRVTHDKNIFTQQLKCIV